MTQCVSRPDATSALLDPNGHPLRILIVDDDALTALDLMTIVSDKGAHPVGVATCAEDALALVDKRRPDVVLMDIALGADDGIETARLIQNTYGSAIVFVSGNTDPQTMSRVRGLGSVPFVSKPVDERELEAAIRIAGWRACRADGRDAICCA